MRNLITEKHKHLLWQDECSDDLLLFEWGSVWKWSDKVLGLNVFDRARCRRMLSQDLIYAHDELDDTFDLCYAYVEKLPLLLATSTWSKRLKINGNRLHNFERRLAHKVIPLRPDKLHNKGNYKNDSI